MKNPEQLLAHADFQVQEMIPGEESQPFLECLSRQFANKPVKYMRLNASVDLNHIYYIWRMNRISTTSFTNVLLQNKSFLSQIDTLFEHSADPAFHFPKKGVSSYYSPSLFPLLGKFSQALSLGGAHPKKLPYTDEGLSQVTLQFLKDLFLFPFSKYFFLHITDAWHPWFEGEIWDHSFLIFSDENNHELTLFAYSDVDEPKPRK